MKLLAYFVMLWLLQNSETLVDYFLGKNHRNIRPRMRAPILFQVNKWRLINYSKWPIYKGKLNSPHDILYTTLLGKIQDGGFIRAFLFSFWTPITWQSTHSRSNISMVKMHTTDIALAHVKLWFVLIWHCRVQKTTKNSLFLAGFELASSDF